MTAIYDGESVGAGGTLNSPPCGHRPSMGAAPCTKPMSHVETGDPQHSAEVSEVDEGQSIPYKGWGGGDFAQEPFNTTPAQYPYA